MTVKLEQEGRTDMDDDAALVCAALIHPDAFGSLYERYRDTFPSSLYSQHGLWILQVRFLPHPATLKLAFVIP